MNLAGLQGEDLAKSGLSPEFDDNSELLSPTDMQERGFYVPEGCAGAYTFPYYDIDGTQLTYDYKTFRDGQEIIEKKLFYRIRLLGTFDAKSAQGKYRQPKGTPTVAYLPRSLPVGSPNKTWLQELQDLSRPLLITEGEKKALAGCKAGVATVGLGGIWNFNNGHNLPVFPLNWLPIGKTVIFAYDFDYKIKTNEDGSLYVDGSGAAQYVSKTADAEECLAGWLMARGLIVRIGRFRTTASVEKIGLDDFIQEGGNLELFMNKSVEFKPTKNDGVVYLNSKYVIFQDNYITPNNGKAFKRTSFLTIEENVRNDKSKMPAFKAFALSKHKQEVQGATFEPDKPNFMITPEGFINTYRGFRSKPVYNERYVNLLEEFFDLFFEADPIMKDPMLDVLAFKVQHPEKNIPKILSIHSPFQGVGKSYFFQIVAEVINGTPYGGVCTDPVAAEFCHAYVTTGDELYDNWNDHISRCIYMVINEFGAKGQAIAAKLKNMATDPDRQVKERYASKKRISNSLLTVVTSNLSAPYLIDHNSRRDLIYCITAGDSLGKRLKEFWMDMKKPMRELSTPEGIAAKHWYLLNRDISELDITADAVKGASFFETLDSALDDLTMFVHEKIVPAPFIIARDEYNRLEAYGLRNYKLKDLKTALKQAGYKFSRKDRSTGQMNFAGLKNVDPRIGSRPYILCFEEYASETDNNLIYKELEKRYCGDKL